MILINKIKKFLKLLNNKTSRRGIFNNIAANIELESLINELDFESVLDIGSSKGQFVLLVEKINPNKIIHSFDPITENIKKQKKFFKNRKNIFFHNYALGNNSVNQDFFITNRNDSSSFLKVKKSNNNDYKILEKRTVPIKKLDQLYSNLKIAKPILVKIDVQGFELNVLKGFEKYLNNVKYLIIEVSDQELYKGQPLSKNLINYLNQRNFFKIKENSPSKINGLNVFQKDILFKNKLFK